MVPKPVENSAALTLIKRAYKIWIRNVEDEDVALRPAAGNALHLLPLSTNATHPSAPQALGDLYYNFLEMLKRQDNGRQIDFNLCGFSQTGSLFSFLYHRKPEGKAEWHTSVKKSPETLKGC